MKILIIRMMGFGDVASILMPAVNYFKKQYPQVEVDVMTFGAGIELMALSTQVNAVLAVSKEQWPDDFNQAVPHFMHLAEIVIAQQYDLVVNLDTWFMPCFLARVLKDTGVNFQGNYIKDSVESLYQKIQSGLITQNYFQITENYLTSSYPSMVDWMGNWWEKHSIKQGYPDFYLKHCCGFDCDLNMRLEIEADLTFKALTKGKKIIALSTGGSKASKQYPYQLQLTSLLEAQGYFVWSDFDGSLPMKTTLARLKVTDLLITVATSTQWLAKLVSCPSLMLSGPLPPIILAAEVSMEKTHDCQFCAKTVCERNIDFACMKIAPEKILEKVQTFLQKPAFSLTEAENQFIQLFLNQQYVQVEESITPMLDAHPNWLNGWKILSDTLLIQGKDAKPAALKALALNSEDAQEHCYYGMMLQKSGDLVGAEHAFTQAIRLKPDYAAAHNNLGIIKKDLGEVEDGITHYKKALALNPSYASCFSNLLFCLSHFEKYDDKALYEMHLKFGEQYERPAKWFTHGTSRSPKRPLRIGFVSADFRQHSVSDCFAPLIEVLEKSTQLTLYAYYNHSIVDETTQRLQTKFNVWRNITDNSDNTFCKQVREDGIDILVDLSGHTAGNRLTAFAMKPAPIQVSWFGYLATTGLKAIDYYLADAFLAPPNKFDAFFTEKIVQLPVNSNFRSVSSAPEVQDLPALKNGYITFGCFNRPSKISAASIQLWSSLLIAVPNSQLLLGAMPHHGAYENMIASFLAHGITKERIQFHVRSDLEGYLNLHHQVDICLDTMPSSGITTTFYAAWMGVPTLCIEGNSVTSRGAMAIMSHLNLTQFIAKDEITFCDIGINCSNHLEALRQVRSNLRNQFKKSLIAKPENLAIALESAFVKMWQVYCNKKSKQTFCV